MSITKSNLRAHDGNLIGFSGKQVPMEGTIRLRVIMRMWPMVINMDVDFLVMDALKNTYNVIMGRMSLNKSWDIVSTIGNRVEHARWINKTFSIPTNDPCEEKS